MTSTSTLRDWWSDYLCDTGEYDRVAFPGPNGDADVWNLYVARAAVPAFEVMADVMGKHGYLFRESSGGTYNCREISGTDVYSLHAYAVCIDLNPSKNPYGTAKTDMPKAFTDELAALRTGNGSRVFTWGMNWTPTTSKDPMHWQIDCSPSDVASGIIYDGGTDMPLDQNDLNKIRALIVDVIGGDRIMTPAVDGSDPRPANAGVVNSVWHSVAYGRKFMDTLEETHDAAVEAANEVAGGVTAHVHDQVGPTGPPAKP